MQPSPPEISIELIGGQCPVQAEGKINGHAFFFRARGTRWSMEIAPSPSVSALDPQAWRWEETFATWPDAGYISQEEALAKIEHAARIWQAVRPAPH